MGRVKLALGGLTLCSGGTLIALPHILNVKEREKGGKISSEIIWGDQAAEYRKGRYRIDGIGPELEGEVLARRIREWCEGGPDGPGREICRVPRSVRTILEGEGYVRLPPYNNADDGWLNVWNRKMDNYWSGVGNDNFLGVDTDGMGGGDGPDRIRLGVEVEKWCTDSQSSTDNYDDFDTILGRARLYCFEEGLNGQQDR